MKIITRILLTVLASSLLPIEHRRGVVAILLDRPCVIQGNPWKIYKDINRIGAPISLMGENAGHNPFNTFPMMNQFGNCIDVHFSYLHETINITIVCRTLQPKVQQCPQYRPGIRWPLANLIYLEYDEERYELASCVDLNSTHAYYGHFLLMEDVASRSHGKQKQLPMWQDKKDMPGATDFRYSQHCDGCNFRNEYIAHVPNIQHNLENAPPEANPYCVEDRAPGPRVLRITRNVVIASLSIALGLLGLSLVLFYVGKKLCYCICRKRTSSA